MQIPLTLDPGPGFKIAFMETKLTIGKLAREAGVSVDTVRYYERGGLLQPAAHSQAGYRLYTPDELRILRFIRRAQALGFSLAEVAELLELVRTSGDRARVRDVATRRLADMEEKLVRLAALRDSLARLVEACRGRGSVDDCPIIEAVLDPEEEE